MKPIKGLDEQDQQNPAWLQALAGGVGKLAEYAFLVFLFCGMCSVIAYVVMISLDVMNSHVPTVPPFGFMFLWSAIWGSSVLALWAGALVKMATKEE